MSDNGKGFVEKSVRDPAFRVPFEYVCQICFKTSKKNSGHKHIPKKDLEKDQLIRERAHEHYLKQKERKRLLKST
jgi:hypothetical protein